METQHVHYLTDEEGRRVAVQLPIDRYEALVEAAEMLEDIRAYDAAKADLEQGTVAYEAFRRSLGLDAGR